MQLPPYCASPFLIAAPGARTSGLHAACFGPGGHHLVHLTCARCLVSLLFVGSLACRSALLHLIQVRPSCTSAPAFACGAPTRPISSRYAMRVMGITGCSRPRSACMSSSLLLLFLTMLICFIRASRRPHRGLLKCVAHYACSSAPMLGALSVVRRVALPPMETGLSYSRLISPAIASYGLLACAVAVVMFVGTCRT